MAKRAAERAVAAMMGLLKENAADGEGGESGGEEPGPLAGAVGVGAGGEEAVGPSVGVGAGGELAGEEVGAGVAGVGAAAGGVAAGGVAAGGVAAGGVAAGGVAAGVVAVGGVAGAGVAVGGCVGAWAKQEVARRPKIRKTWTAAEEAILWFLVMERDFGEGKIVWMREKMR